ncbi:LacI family DNA-binding transcriptional regulator [Galbitalea sp. SE-J8]|uniref:LacI family DNA-binding transcriptional regulator n=1 Tax=Galbitalea sp. SE-J8 TaxID=3054952 RepID=UPI00259C6AEC|nr:LacI family DNA-binding transcriptional regulator [Galbitalea sp. SE-J8]MDM4762027.1 LacI family DNA-binding transcriptional regulator [Galbitalea sp. SE-J8]
MRNVASLAGVGLKTVSRVINGEPNVAPATMERVRAAAAQLNYQPDLHAGNLRRTNRRSGTLGLLVGNVANPFSASVHRGVEDVASPLGVAVFASSLDDDPERERSAVEAFLRRRVDGLILTSIDTSQAYLGIEIDRGTPVVFVDRMPSGLDADTVVTDNAEGTARAVQHLAAAGHRRIAYLGDRSDIWTARERRRGFIDELRRLGLTARPEWIVDGMTDEVRAADAVTRLLTLDEPPTAIFSAQNLVTVGAVVAMRALGALDRVALVGFDDFPLADLLTPAVTVIAQDPLEIGRVAAGRVFARLDGDRGPVGTLTVPTRLIVRGSGEVRPHD